MSSKAITEKPESSPPPRLPMRETAPSVMQEDAPHVARTIGMLGFLLAVLGGILLAVYASKEKVLFGSALFGPAASIFYTVLGLGLMLFHATSDRDLQIRRSYGVLGFLWIGTGALVTVLPINGPSGTNFLPWGFLALFLGLLFLLPFLRNETDKSWRNAGIFALAVCGAALALTGMIGGNVSPNFLLPAGLLASILGIAYLGAFMAVIGVEEDAGYWTGVITGLAGLVVLLIALGRALLPYLFYRFKWTSTPPDLTYFPTAGLLLMLLGLLYAAVAIGICSDYRLIVLTRRELAAYFSSPIAYIVLLAFAAVAWGHFYDFLQTMESSQETQRPLTEPIVQYYALSLVPVIALMFIVPTLTMRQLSEELRSGTLEVLLTAPLGEASIVLSKFLAALIFYMVLWLPWGFMLVALRLENNHPFDYRPLLSFGIALICSGAGFLSMGLFFSSLSRSQIIAAILTFVGMTFLLGIYLYSNRLPESSVLRSVLAYISFIDLWFTALRGLLAPKDLLFPISATVFWLFLTIKVLEARKWT